MRAIFLLALLPVANPAQALNCYDSYTCETYVAPAAYRHEYYFWQVSKEMDPHIALAEEPWVATVTCKTLYPGEAQHMSSETEHFGSVEVEVLNEAADGWHYDQAWVLFPTTPWPEPTILVDNVPQDTSSYGSDGSGYYYGAYDGWTEQDFGWAYYGWGFNANTDWYLG